MQESVSTLVSARRFRCNRHLILVAVLWTCVMPVGASGLVIDRTVGPGETLLVDFQLDPERIASLPITVPDDVNYLSVLVRWPRAQRGPVMGTLFDSSADVLGSRSYPGTTFGSVGVEFVFFDFGDILTDLTGRFTFLNEQDPAIEVGEIEFRLFTDTAGYVLFDTTGSVSVVPEPSITTLLCVGILGLGRRRSR